MATSKDISRVRKWQAENPKRYRLTQYKKCARLRGIDFNLSDEQFFSFWQQPCSYCGSDIQEIGIDRVDNSIGYQIDNVVPCCSICNKMKLTMSYDIWIKHIEKILAYRPHIIATPAKIIQNNS